MSASVVSNTSRITVLSAQFRADLAVPAHTSVAELLATLVASLGREVADEGAAQGGWTLQRAGEPPLDPSATLAASQVRDGDVLHLRTRSTQLPEVAFDDVLEAVATGVMSRTARWHPRQTRIATSILATALLLFVLVVLLFSGPSWTIPAITAGVGAAALLATGAALRRAFDQRGAAITSAAFGVAFAAEAGATSLGNHHDLLAFGAPQLLTGAGAAVLAAVVAAVVVGAGLAGFVVVVAAGILAIIGTAVADTTSLSASGTAALIAAAGLAVSPALPMLSFRLSQLPLPAIPTDAADLRRDDGRIDAAQILRQAASADQFLTGLVGGVAVAIAGAAVVLSTAGVSERVLALVLGAICLLRARLFTGRGQRILLLASGGVALLAVLVDLATRTHGTERVLAIAVPAVVLALALFGLVSVLPGRRYTPSWSRMADTLETLLVLSVIPLALAVMGVYGGIRTAVS